MSRSPMVIAVSAGNPGRVRDFADLAKGECSVILPDPTSSGAGEWGVLAVYGSALRETGDAKTAADRLAALWPRVKHRPPSARRARALFKEGAGDALVTYESEIRAWKFRDTGRPFFMVYPPRTILSEHLVVKLHRNITGRSHERVDAFVKFLWSKPAQRLLVAHGFRSVDPEVAREAGGTPSGSSFGFFTLQDLGGAVRAEEAVSRFCGFAQKR
jgi:sulfate/thiosulfate transport system substrate-binding protein